jgi:uncharacterized membrane protein YdbT with pleckstrin-like domain
MSNMGYINNILQPEETILAIGHMHWVIFTRGLIALIVASFALLWPVGDTVGLMVKIIGGLVALYGVINLARNWIDKVTTEVAVTNRRVIHKRGLIRRETVEMNMDKVESVAVDQTIMGRLLGYGSITVRGTGSGLEGLHHIAHPLAIRSAIVVH